MKIYISEEDVIRGIQEKFQAVYPWLRLRFYKHPHGEGEGSPRCEQLTPDTPLDDIRMTHGFGWIDVGPRRTVAAVEKDFYRQFGLCVQVFRKGRNCWLETTDTDRLTLGEQNNRGRACYTLNFEEVETDPL